MAAIAVGLQLKKQRPLARANPLDRHLRCAAHLENVHAVHLDAFDAETLAAAVKLVFRARAIDARAHGILVVFDHVDDGELPQLRHVEAFVHLPLVRRAVTEIGEADIAVALVFVCESKPGTKRHLCGDDARRKNRARH